mgnify:CR=1 FL=1
MIIWKLLLGDLKFQAIYGFYWLYGIVTVFYAAVLLLLPQEWRGKVAVAMIYSDPAALGLIFMGAIILLEKSQRVLDALVVSPAKVSDYLMAKVGSLCLISVVAAFFLALIAEVENLFMIVTATAITSLIFSLLGLIIGAKINSLNHYLFAIVPIEIICFVPPLIYLFKPFPWLSWHPLCGAIALINGSSSTLSYDFSRLLLLLVLLFIVAKKITVKMWKSLGGVSI